MHWLKEAAVETLSDSGQRRYAPEAADACVNYPKAQVPYTITDGKIVMKSGDLATAYKNTLQPSLP